MPKAILLALLAACGAHTNSATAPDEQPIEPPEQDLKENVYFCCNNVDHKTKTGDGCVTVGEKEIDRCSTVLVCSDGLTKKDGVVTCF
jgi:hypothetical protein